MIWFDGSFVATAVIDPLSHSLHYGGAVFEGIRFYGTLKGVAIFRLADHVNRLFFSAESLGMVIPFSRKEIADAVIGAVKLSGFSDGYIRPLVFRDGGLGLSANGLPVHVMVAVIPWAKGKSEVSLKVSSFIRLHPQSTVLGVKASGHYVNSFLASAEARGQGADDALLLDYQGNIAETSVANIFLVNGSTIITPSPSCIFAGITRDSIIQLCGYAGIVVSEENIPLETTRGVEGMFIAGTAAEITQVEKLDGQPLVVSELGQRCSSLYMMAVYGRLAEFCHWLTFVE
ncbi:MAG: aminotransferase class IV [Candidatus Doudnabacteria bacterium]|jgi:branched-chain amino acid aminotransferase